MIIDISMPLDAGTPIYPGDPPLEIRAVRTLDEGCHVSHIALGTHTGTHVDAPAHFVRGGAALGEIPLDRFVGTAWVLELPDARLVTREALVDAWPAHDPVERVLLKTGNSRRSRAGDPQTLSLEAAEWLVGMEVGLVGIDALSIEAAGDGSYPVHHTLLGADVVVLEGVDLSRVTPGPYELACLPLKLDVPDGAPVRAVLRPLGR